MESVFIQLTSISFSFAVKRFGFLSLFRLVLILVSGLGFSMEIQGQDGTLDPPGSIVGETFTRVDIFTHGNHSYAGTTPLLKRDYDVILISAGDTLRTKTDNNGRFSFSGITASRITLLIEPIRGTSDFPFSGTFELMPGENIVLVPIQREPYPEGSVIQLSNQPLMTADGDTWVYHCPVMSDSGYAGREPGVEEELIGKLIGKPGVEYDKRKRLIYIPNERIRRTEVNGAYVFALKPE